MFLSRWKGHFKLLQPLTLFCDVLALAALAVGAVIFTPISLITSWIFKVFNMEGPGLLKWSIIGFCTLSLALKYWIFKYKGLKESQWVDKKWLKEFHHFTPSQLDHYAEAHQNFHRIMGLIWTASALLNFGPTGFLILGIFHVISTFYWKQYQHKTSKMILPHGEVEHFPMEIMGTVENPLDSLEAIESKVWGRGEAKLTQVSHTSSAVRNAGHMRHPTQTLKHAVRHKVKHTAKKAEEKLKPSH